VRGSEKVEERAELPLSILNFTQLPKYIIRVIASNRDLNLLLRMFVYFVNHCCQSENIEALNFTANAPSYLIKDRTKGGSKPSISRFCLFRP